MEKKILFRGVGTALITPFKSGGIDLHAYERIINYQIEGGVSAIIAAGTTGEACTLTDTERYRLYEAAVRFARGKVPVILGTGTNDTARTLEYTKMAEDIGADGVLLVSPYYNRGTEEGIYRHFAKIAEECKIPQILYNVPSRTGVNISIENLTRLAAYPNIVGIKEASGSLMRLIDISAKVPDLPLYSGNDGETYSTLSLGGLGVISVAANAVPSAMAEITNRYFANDFSGSFEIQKSLSQFISSLFLETNPSPIKYAMELLGFCEGEIRLPLFVPTEATRRAVKRELDAVMEINNNS